MIPGARWCVLFGLSVGYYTLWDRATIQLLPNYFSNYFYHLRKSRFFSLPRTFSPTAFHSSRVSRVQVQGGRGRTQPETCGPKPSCRAR